MVDMSNKILNTYMQTKERCATCISSRTFHYFQKNLCTTNNALYWEFTPIPKAC